MKNLQKRKSAFKKLSVLKCAHYSPKTKCFRTCGTTMIANVSVSLAILTTITLQCAIQACNVPVLCIAEWSDVYVIKIIPKIHYTRFHVTSP